MGNDYSHLKTEYGVGKSFKDSLMDYIRKLELRYGRKDTSKMLRYIDGKYCIDIYGRVYPIKWWEGKIENELICSIDHDKSPIKPYKRVFLKERLNLLD